jgi:hypothetical protein
MGNIVHTDTQQKREIEIRNAGNAIFNKNARFDLSSLLSDCVFSLHMAGQAFSSPKALSTGEEIWFAGKQLAVPVHLPLE